MSRKAKVEITAETVRNAISSGKPASMTQLAHQLGYHGSVSSSLTGRFRQLVPDVDNLLASCKSTGASPNDAKPPKATPVHARPASRGKGKGGKWPRHPQNPFREGSYGTCFDILAAPAHEGGLPRERLIELLAKGTGKDMKRAAFDAQVVLSARGADGPNLNPFEGPRNRSARFGYWVKRENSHVQLVLPAASPAQ